MNEINGLIIAAGKGSRFGDFPKVLVPFKDLTLLDYNIIKLKYYVDIIYVVCHSSHKEAFDSIIDCYEDVILIILDNQDGDGDAVLQALGIIKPISKILLVWGDCICNDKILRQLIDNSKADLNIAVQFEEKPYVRINVSEDNNIEDVEFSKYKKIKGSGFHDLSAFLFEKNTIFLILYRMYEKYFVDNEYKTNNKELNFLNILNETEYKYTRQIVEIQSEKLIQNAFNTKKELNNILKEKLNAEKC